MPKIVGMGVVGAGAIGIRGALTHLSQEDVQDRVRSVAVCDPVPGRAKAAADKFGVPAAYESYEELLKDPNVDAVTICSPIGLHHRQGMQAIEAGKHVHFNKTMATAVAECTEMMEAAAKRKALPRIGPNSRETAPECLAPRPYSVAQVNNAPPSLLKRVPFLRNRNALYCPGRTNRVPHFRDMR